MELTDKEEQLLNAIMEGMDEPGCGWLHELDPFNGSKTTSGVVSSLVKKGLIHSYEDEEVKDCYWVEIVV